MRISINTGFDSAATSYSNSDNFVLDSASNIPNSLVEMEDIKNDAADKSATPAFVSDLARLDLNLDHKPSMVETHGFFSKLFGTKSNSQVETGIFDYGGSYIAHGLGKLAENEKLLRELTITDTIYDSVHPNTNFIEASKRLIEGVNLFKECFATYNIDQKNTYVTNSDLYETFRKTMKGKAKCKFHVDAIPFSDEDVDIVSDIILNREYPELRYCASQCGIFTSNPNGMCVLFRNLQFSPKELWFDALHSASHIKDKKARPEDYDAALGKKILAIYDQLVGVAMCELYQNNPSEMHQAFQNDFKSLVKEDDSSLLNIRECLVRDVDSHYRKGVVHYFMRDSHERNEQLKEHAQLQNHINELKSKITTTESSESTSQKSKLPKWRSDLQKLQAVLDTMLRTQPE